MKRDFWEPSTVTIPAKAVSAEVIEKLRARLKGPPPLGALRDYRHIIESDPIIESEDLDNTEYTEWNDEHG